MKKFWIRLDWRITLLYVAFGALWIFFSDMLLAQLVPDPEMQFKLQHYKGCFFVLISALAFFTPGGTLMFKTVAETRQWEFQEWFQQKIETIVNAVLRWKSKKKCEGEPHVS